MVILIVISFFIRTLLWSVWFVYISIQSKISILNNRSYGRSSLELGPPLQ